MRDGGPAFPMHVHIQSDDLSAVDETGMSLRDYLAIHASDKDVDKYSQPGTEQVKGFVTVLSRAEARYRFADAMLKARKES